MFLSNSYFHNYKPSPRILCQQYILQNHGKNKDIIIKTPEKGIGVVILEQERYNNAIQEIISGTSKFRKLNEDSNLKHEASQQDFLRKLKLKNSSNENEYDTLHLSCSAPAFIYGTPKTRKLICINSFPKLCIIVSSISTFDYNFSRFLFDFLSPLVPNNYSCKDTFFFSFLN